MKAILKFDLSDFDSKQAHLRAIKSLNLVLALQSILDEFRQIEKYDKKNEVDQEFIYNILNRYNINLDELSS